MGEFYGLWYANNYSIDGVYEPTKITSTGGPHCRSRCFISFRFHQTTQWCWSKPNGLLHDGTIYWGQWLNHQPLWKMMEFVNWDDYSQLNGKIKFMFQTSNQIFFPGFFMWFFLDVAISMDWIFREHPQDCHKISQPRLLALLALPSMLPAKQPKSSVYHVTNYSIAHDNTI